MESSQDSQDNPLLDKLEANLGFTMTPRVRGPEVQTVKKKDKKRKHSETQVTIEPVVNAEHGANGVARKKHKKNRKYRPGANQNSGSSSSNGNSQNSAQNGVSGSQGQPNTPKKSGNGGHVFSGGIGSVNGYNSQRSNGNHDDQGSHKRPKTRRSEGSQQLVDEMRHDERDAEVVENLKKGPETRSDIFGSGSKSGFDGKSFGKSLAQYGIKQFVSGVGKKNNFVSPDGVEIPASAVVDEVLLPQRPKHHQPKQKKRKKGDRHSFSQGSQLQQDVTDTRFPISNDENNALSDDDCLDTPVTSSIIINGHGDSRLTEREKPKEEKHARFLDSEQDDSQGPEGQVILIEDTPPKKKRKSSKKHHQDSDVIKDSQESMQKDGESQLTSTKIKSILKSNSHSTSEIVNNHSGKATISRSTSQKTAVSSPYVEKNREALLETVLKGCQSQQQLVLPAQTTPLRNPYAARRSSLTQNQPQSETETSQKLQSNSANDSQAQVKEIHISLPQSSIHSRAETPILPPPRMFPSKTSTLTQSKPDSEKTQESVALDRENPKDTSNGNTARNTGPPPLQDPVEPALQQEQPSTPTEILAIPNTWEQNAGVIREQSHLNGTTVFENIAFSSSHLEEAEEGLMIADTLVQEHGLLTKSYTLDLGLRGHVNEEVKTVDEEKEIDNRICIVTAGKVSVKLVSPTGNGVKFRVGKGGLWRIRVGESCMVRKKGNQDSKVLVLG